VNLFTPDAAPLGRPYWWEDGAALPDLPNQLPEKTDVLIVGAGYTGLNAALTAADAGAQVVVVDAGIPGEGASTRNGGMFGAHPRIAYEALVARFGDAAARGIYQEAQAAYDYTRNVIEREEIDCDFLQTGRIQSAWTQAHFASQKNLVAGIAQVAEMNIDVLERSELTNEIATEQYFGGLRFPEHAALHPRKFHDGLLAAVLQRGVTVVQNCPIKGVEKSGASFIARSTGGATQADKVILATNGYTGSTFSWLHRRVFPLPSFIIATEQLDQGTIEKLAPGQRMMVETRARHSYYRVSPDGTRILYGGRASMRPLSPEKAAARLHATMCQVWPELQSVKLTHSWSGNTGYSFTHMPHVGVCDGMHYSAGYSGSGVAVAPYLGMKVAKQAIGDPSGDTAYSLTPLESRAFYFGGAPRFLGLAEFWYRQVVDRRESAGARVRGRKSS